MNDKWLTDKLEKLGRDASSADSQIKGLRREINGSIKDVKEHIKSGQSWRIGIVSSVVLLVINLIVWASLFGRIQERTEAIQDSLKNHKSKHEISYIRQKGNLIDEIKKIHDCNEEK